ncbi:M15 family metallopeptidase [Actinokineospora sp. PR83]|uniref:M15 family metallopeptidase n=1 Tax=Actinokineospora sp. PR83 TaxID=2884908 RepID=UPI0027E1C800|nr:M15 family metallopeptidase [Actinokineospora sp. PR83]MCG8918315.1 M15 family metallopeptidase [Actinokineospora sp. PR83]
MFRRSLDRLITALSVALVLGACTTPEEQGRAAAASPDPPAPTAAASPTTTAPPSATGAPPTSAPPPPTTTAAPAWVVGATPLPLRPDGFGQVLPTPAVLADRALPTADLLPPPADGRFAATVAPVPDAVVARSTWQPGCPVALAELRYLTMSFWGFDGKAHTGEMIVNASAAEGVAGVFRALYAERFPIEEMRVTAAPELDLAPTGDGNNTGAFVCRKGRKLSSWSAHAYGLALDINPFCNPYVQGDLVLPELASSYVDRKNRRPGMVFAGDTAVRAFAAIGWSWGGEWSSPKDIQHFSALGR